MANSSFGGAVKLTGESEYQNAIKGITNNLRVLSSEMKIVTSEFGKNEDNISSLNQKNDILNKKLKEQKEKLNEAQTALTKMNNQYQESTNSHNNLIEKYGTEKAKLDKLASTLGTASNEYKKHEKHVKELENAVKNSTKTQETNEKKIADMKIAYNNCQADINKTTKEIENNKKTLDKLKNANVENITELKNFEKAEESAGNSSLKLGDIIKANLISEAIISGFKGLVSAVKSAASSFGEWAKMSNALKEQEAKVTQVMHNTTDATDEEIQALIDLTAQKEKLGVVSQETQLAGLQELGTYVENKESLEALLPVMNDMIAQQYGVGASMESASGIATMMGKVLGNGQVDALSRLGYKFDEAQQKVLKFGTEEEKVKVLSEIVSQSVGGMNEALALTNAGKVAIATSYIDDMKKSVGGLFSDIKNGIIAEFLPSITLVSDSITGMISGDISVEEGINKISEALTTGVETIQAILPQLLETGIQILTSILNGIVSMIPNILPVMINVAMSLVNFLIQNLPTIINSGIEILLALIKGISDSLPTLIPVVVDAVLTIVENLINNIDMIIDAGIQLLVGLAQGLINAIPQLLDRIPIIIDKLITAITDNLPKLIEMGITLIVQLGIGLIKAIPQLISKIPQIISSIIDGFANFYSKLGEVGLNLIKGLWNGISNAGAWLRDKISGFFGGVVDSIKNFFGIHSPSTLFRDEIGSNLAKGIGVGFEAEMSDINKQMANAIQTDYDFSINSNLNNNSSLSSTNTSFDNVIFAFKTALKEMKIELDDEVAGRFVENTVSKLVYN